MHRELFTSDHLESLSDKMAFVAKVLDGNAYPPENSPDYRQYIKTHPSDNLRQSAKMVRQGLLRLVRRYSQLQRALARRAYIALHLEGKIFDTKDDLISKTSSDIDMLGNLQTAIDDCLRIARIPALQKAAGIATPRPIDQDPYFLLKTESEVVHTQMVYDWILKSDGIPLRPMGPGFCRESFLQTNRMTPQNAIWFYMHETERLLSGLDRTIQVLLKNSLGLHFIGAASIEHALFYPNDAEILLQEGQADQKHARQSMMEASGLLEFLNDTYVVAQQYRHLFMPESKDEEPFSPET